MAVDPNSAAATAATTVPAFAGATTMAAARPLTSPPPLSRPISQLSQPPSIQLHNSHLYSSQPFYAAQSLPIRAQNPHSNSQLSKAHDPVPQGVLYPVASSGRGFIPKGARPLSTDQMVTVANPGVYPPPHSLVFPHGVRPMASPHLDYHLNYPLHMARPPNMQYAHLGLVGGAASGPVKGVPVSAYPKVAPRSTNGYKDTRERSREDAFTIVRDRKISNKSGTPSTIISSNSSSSSSTTSSTLMASEFLEPPSMVINHRFNGKNYLQWSQSVLRYICGKRKEKYINGAAPQPAPDDPTFDTWFAENNQVMTWLCNSMTVDISEGYLLENTAKEIWDAARRTYSFLDNTAALIHLKRQLRDLRQGTLTVTDYYNALLKLWQQQDLFEVHPWKHVEDAQLYKKIVEEGRVYDFLLGLNDSFEEIRGRIMGIKPLPHLFDVVNHVQFEESRKLLNRSTPSPVESSALVVRGSQEERKNKWCHYCKKKGHIKEECWKLHGKPSTSKPQGHLTSTEPKAEDTTSLSPEELQMLRRILEKQNKSNSLLSVNLVQSGFTLGKDDWDF